MFLEVLPPQCAGLAQAKLSGRSIAYELRVKDPKHMLGASLTDLQTG